MNEIIIALITGGVSLLVCMINNHFQSKKTTALMEYKIDQLTKKVEKHNNLVDRTYQLEKNMQVYDEKFKVVNHRIEDLECKEGR